MWAFLCTFTPKYAYIMYKEIKTAETYHVPVLLDESVGGLNIKKGGIYVDVTFGGGGHSREILSRLDPTARLFSFDQDADAESNIGEPDDRFTFVRSNFRYLKNWMRYYGIDHIDGLLADLGVEVHVELKVRQRRRHELSVAAEDVASYRSCGNAVFLNAVAHLRPEIALCCHYIQSLHLHRQRDECYDNGDDTVSWH